jgi:hypothetical protein
MPFPIPSQAEQVVTNPPRMTQAWYAFLYNLWKPLRNLWSVDDGKLLFMDGDTVNGATVGANLELDRTTNTLNAVGGEFPEAPLDGRQYGRQMANWTVVEEGGSDTVPGDPVYSVQYNDAGAFGGDADVLMNPATRLITVGAVLGAWTLKPAQQPTAGQAGWDLTIAGGKSLGPSAITHPGGTLKLIGGAPNDAQVTSISGNVEISTPDGAAVTHGYTGNITLTAGTALGSGSAGDIQITGGIAGGNTAGSVVIAGGSGLTGGNGGDASLSGGDGAQAGDVLISGGDTVGIQTGGIIRIEPGSSVTGTDGHIDLILQGTSDLRIDGDPGTAGWFLTSGGTNAPPSWTASGGAATPPGGANTQVQFNDGGAFGGDAGLTFVKATNALTLTGPFTVGGQIDAADGTAAAPGYSFTSNLDMGLYWEATDELGVAVAGANVLTWSQIAATSAVQGIFPASTNGGSGYASIRLPHGVPPTTNIADGDFWTTAAGAFARISGATVGPFIDASGAGVADGDYGDIIVSGGGTNWALDSALGVSTSIGFIVASGNNLLLP